MSTDIREMSRDPQHNQEAEMTRTIMMAAAGAMLLGTTIAASAQHLAVPQDRYYGGWGYYGGPVYAPPFAPGYYDYAPGYYYGYAPGYFYGDGDFGWDW
jgi:hypothetical protein